MNGTGPGPWLALGLALADPWPTPGWPLAWPLAGLSIYFRKKIFARDDIEKNSIQTAVFSINNDRFVNISGGGEVCEPEIGSRF